LELQIPPFGEPYITKTCILTTTHCQGIMNEDSILVRGC
jgi:hypothetical protein